MKHISSGPCVCYITFFYKCALIVLIFCILLYDELQWTNLLMMILTSISGMNSNYWVAFLNELINNFLEFFICHLLCFVILLNINLISSFNQLITYNIRRFLVTLHESAYRYMCSRSWTPLLLPRSLTFLKVLLVGLFLKVPIEFIGGFPGGSGRFEFITILFVL